VVMGVGYNPRIVTDGLVLCLDAANKRSYPGSGTTWIDKVGGNNGTLTNMDASNFDSANGGSLSFDGSNEYVTCGAKSEFEFTTGDSISTSCWVKPANTSSQSYQAMFTIGGSTGVLRDRVYQVRIWNTRQVDALYRNSFNSQWQIKLTNGSHVNNNEWVNIATTYTYGAGGSWKIYINGKEVPSYYQQGNGNQAPINTTNDELFIGHGEDANGEEWLGNIANVLLYRRYLSPEEVLQNYEATKGRYA
jgi:hypothetical protein